MSLVEIVLLAVGLSMDAFAVAVGKGLAMRRPNHLQALALALTFGVFQGGMPLLGWAVGSQFAGAIEAIDHWIAFALLAAIGGKMLYEAWSHRDDEEPEPDDSRLSLRLLLVLGVATSIDALAAGIGFAFLQLDIWLVVSLVAGITFVLSYAGVVLGHQFGSRWERPAEVAGGAILIVIGLKILAEHLGLIAF